MEYRTTIFDMNTHDAWENRLAWNGYKMLRVPNGITSKNVIKPTFYWELQSSANNFKFQTQALYNKLRIRLVVADESMHVLLFHVGTNGIF